jgi:transposase
VSNVLNEEKRNQVIALGRLGWSLRRIEETTGIRRETAAAHLKSAGIAVRKPGGWGKNPVPDSKPAIEGEQVTTDSGSPVPPGPSLEPAIEATTEAPATTTASACEPWRELIEKDLAYGRNAMAIWQDLVDRHSFSGAYESVKRFAQKLRGAHTPEARAVIVTEPGEEAQVDYGEGPMVFYPKTGKYRRTRLFVMTLGYSRKCIRLLSFLSSSRIWGELHETAFRRLGGVPRVVVLDNLREGVIAPDFYDPTINPVYRDLLSHYGTVALPCRVRDPDRKGKVESGVGHAQKTPLKGKRFEAMEQAQQYLDHWETHWADTRIHGTTKRQVSAMFAEEKPALKPLPLEPFRFYEHGKRTVNLDGCVEVEAAYYSVPPGYIGQVMQAQWDGVFVRILHPKTGQLLREHLRQQRGHHRIKDEDRSKRAPWGVVKLLARAACYGERIGMFCAKMHQLQGEEAVRRLQGVLSFVKKYGAGPVEAACATALDLEIHDFRFVRRYLEREPNPAVSLRQIDPLIRQLTQYRDLIEERTKEPTTNESL